MIISGGENIYSWEVEEALRAHPDVADVAVIAVPDEVWGESVKACVQMRPGRSASEVELIDYTRSKIASYKKPRSIDFVQSLPRLFNGKIDKKALRAPYWRGHDRQVSGIPKPPWLEFGPRSACSRPSCAPLAWKPHER